jgi:hypothetical protein
MAGGGGAHRFELVSTTGPRQARRVRAAAAAAAILLAAVLAAAPPIAIAASPSPTRAASTDTRSPLEGPGFVGAPLAAILAVLAIAVVAILVTTAYVRLTAGRGDRRPPD